MSNPRVHAIAAAIALVVLLAGYAASSEFAPRCVARAIFERKLEVDRLSRHIDAANEVRLSPDTRYLVGSLAGAMSLEFHAFFGRDVMPMRMFERQLRVAAERELQGILGAGDTVPEWMIVKAIPAQGALDRQQTVVQFHRTLLSVIARWEQEQQGHKDYLRAVGCLEPK